MLVHPDLSLYLKYVQNNTFLKEGKPIVEPEIPDPIIQKSNIIKIKTYISHLLRELRNSQVHQ